LRTSFLGFFSIISILDFVFYYSSLQVGGLHSEQVTPEAHLGGQLGRKLLLHSPVVRFRNVSWLRVSLGSFFGMSFILVNGFA